MYQHILAYVRQTTYNSAPPRSSFDSSTSGLPASLNACVDGARHVTFLEASRAGHKPALIRAPFKAVSLLSSAALTVWEQDRGGRRTLQMDVSVIPASLLGVPHLSTIWNLLAFFSPQDPSTAVILMFCSSPARRLTTAPLISPSALFPFCTLEANTT